MKKVLFLSLAASAVMASCSNEVLDSVVPQEPQAISFENAFIDKGTRAEASSSDQTTANIAKFYVYGSNGTKPTYNKNVFTNILVTKGGESKWTYEKPVYWEDKDYQFIAYSNGAEATTTGTPSYNDATGVLTIGNYVNDGTKDLVCSNLATAHGNPTGTNEAVGLTFGHKLSKVYFTFVAKELVKGQTMTISNIIINNAGNTATYTSNPEAWGVATKETSFTYTDKALSTTSSTVGVSSSAMYMIPQETGSLTANFTVALKDNNQHQSPIEVTIENVPLKLTHNGGKWLINTTYNYTATITRDHITLGEPIEFTVTEVNGWAKPEQGVEPNIPTPETK